MKRLVLLCGVLVAGCGAAECGAYAGRLSVDDTARACAMSISCGGSVFGVYTSPTTASACVAAVENGITVGRMTIEQSGNGKPVDSFDYPELLQGFVSCGAAARDCDQFGRCLRGLSNRSCAPPGGPPCDGSSCDGTVASFCLSGHLVRTDCARFGGHCEVANGQLVCVPDAQECSTDRCEGDSLAVCTNGRYLPIDCASVGLRTCEQVGGPFAWCKS